MTRETRPFSSPPARRLCSRLLRARLLVYGVALLVAYAGLAALLPNAMLIETLHAIRIAVGVTVAVAYGPTCLAALVARRPDRVHQLSLGITMAWIATVLGGIWALLWRLSRDADWLVNASINGLWIWLAILGGLLHLTAPGAIDGVVPRRNWILIGVAFGAGALSATLIIIARPDVTILVQTLEPYLRE